MRVLSSVTSWWKVNATPRMRRLGGVGREAANNRVEGATLLEIAPASRHFVKGSYGNHNLGLRAGGDDRCFRFGK